MLEERSRGVVHVSSPKGAGTLESLRTVGTLLVVMRPGFRIEVIVLLVSALAVAALLGGCRNFHNPFDPLSPTFAGGQDDSGSDSQSGDGADDDESQDDLDDAIKPDTPSNVVVQFAERPGTVVIYWDAVSGAEGYRLYHGLSDDFEDMTVVAEGALSDRAVGHDALSEKTHYYRLVAYQGSASSDPSDPREIDLANIDPESSPVGSPAKPANVTAVRHESAVELSWNPVNQSDVYALFRSTPSGNEGTLRIIEVVRASVSGFQDTPPTGGAAYTYGVVAVNQSGWSHLGTADLN